MEYHIHLQNQLTDVCQQIMQADIHDCQTDVIRRSVYQLILDSYEDIPFQTVIRDSLCNTANKVLIMVFHNFVKEHSILQLSTWVNFISQEFHQFKQFYDDIMHPFILFVQDEYVSSFMKTKHHPFGACMKQLCSLFHVYTAIIQDAIHDTIHTYVETSTEYILQQCESAHVKSQMSYAMLQTWFQLCVYYKLLFAPKDFFKNQFINYLPNNFGKHKMESCHSMYSFLSLLFDKACQYQTLLTPRLSSNFQYKIIVELCYHYGLYEHWSKASYCLFYGESTENQNLFYWNELLLAFQNMDVDTCFRYYQSMCNTSTKLSKYKPFTPIARNTQIRKYFLSATRMLDSDLKTIRKYWLFIEAFVDKIKEDSTVCHHDNELLHQFSWICGTEFYNKIFKDKDDDTVLQHLLTLCIDEIHDENDMHWFISIWHQYKHKDVFLHNYIEKYVKPQIEKNTIDIQREDMFLVCMFNYMQDECTTQLKNYQTLLSEYYQRSFTDDAFVVNRTVWNIETKAMMQLHIDIQEMVNKKTKQYTDHFPNRTIQWDMHKTWCDTEFAFDDGKQSKLLKLHVNLWTLNILLWIDETKHTTIEKLLNHLYGEHCSALQRNVTRRYLSYLEDHHILNCQQDIRINEPHSILKEVNMKTVPEFDLNAYETVEHVHAPKCYERMMDKKQTLQAKMTQYLKQLHTRDANQQITIEQLLHFLRTNIVSFEPTLDDVKDQLDSLEDRGYIVLSLNKTNVQYMP